MTSRRLSIVITTLMVGIISDHCSARLLQSIGLLILGISTIFMAFYSDMRSLMLFYFVNGIGQAFGLPIVLKITKQNTRSTQYATVTSIMLIAINLSGIVSPLLYAYVSQFYGWRLNIVISAFIALIFSFVSYFLVKEESKNRNQLNKIAQCLDENTFESKETYSDILQYPMLWVCIICRIIVNISRGLLTDWAILYLIKVKLFSIFMSSYYLSVVEVGSVLGKLLAAYVSDLLVKNTNSSSSAAHLTARLPVSIVLFGVNAFGLFLFTSIGDNYYMNAWFILTVYGILIGASSAGLVVTITVLSTDIASDKTLGLCLSLTNLSAKVSGLISSYPIALMASYYSWDFTFNVFSLLSFFAIILLLVVPKYSSKLKIE